MQVVVQEAPSGKWGLWASVGQYAELAVGAHPRTLRVLTLNFARRPRAPTEVLRAPGQSMQMQALLVDHRLEERTHACC